MLCYCVQAIHYHHIQGQMIFNKVILTFLIYLVVENLKCGKTEKKSAMTGQSISVCFKFKQV